MKSIFTSLVIILITFQIVQAQSAGLGNYPATVISTASGNTTVLPSAAPVNTTSISAFTSTRFKGSLEANPLTGVVTVTNAHPAGTYTITVVAFNGLSTATENFSLVVNNTLCSQGFFSPGTDVPAGISPRSVAVGDFNGDGLQDIAAADNINNTTHIRLGNGLGGFTGTTAVSVGTSPVSVVISDFNGDGKEDLATANLTGNSISIRLGDGTGVFAGTTDITVGMGPYALATGDFNGDGKKDIATANSIDNTISVCLGDGTGNFSVSGTVSTGAFPISVAVGDFNGDGNQDLAAVNNIDNTVSIRMGNGSGSFSGNTDIMVGFSAYSVAVGDFNTDGLQDLAVANSSSYNVSILIGDGTGSFTAGTDVYVGSDPRSVVIGDFNGDGKQDIATANQSNYSVSIRLGDGLGNFTLTAELFAGADPESIALGDFNGDGKQDIAAADTSTGNISILLGAVNGINVQGNNTSISDADLTPSPTDHTDFGNVGNFLVRTFTIQNTGQANLSINNINVSGADASMFTMGGINLPAAIPAGGSADFSITFIPTGAGQKEAVIDIISDNCDIADYDFAIQGTGVMGVTPTLGIYPATTITNAGGNAVITPTAAPTDALSTTATASGNFKGLIQVDPITGLVNITDALMAGTYIITIRANNGLAHATSSFILTVNNTLCSQGHFSGSTEITVGSNPVSLVLGDFNADGNQDFASTNVFSDQLSISMGNGAGGFTGAADVAIGSNSYNVTTGDFNGDGKQDLAATNISLNSVSIRLGDGTGGFSGSTEVSVGNSPFKIAIADFNNDGKQDFAVSNFSGNSISIRLGDGSGGFYGNSQISLGNNPLAIVTGDFNNDGNEDLAVSNYNDNNVSILIGNGTGGFNIQANVSVGNNPWSISTGDFNADGKLDFAAVNGTDNNVSIRLGDGTGSFSSAADVIAGDAPRSVVAGDFNGDGMQDLAIANNGINTISIQLGDGTGSFSGTLDVASGVNPFAIVAGDFNNDGKQDLAVANAGDGTVSIRTGQANEINVQGNNTDIADGANSPSFTDDTDFGTAASGNIVTRSFTIQNTSNVNLRVSDIVINGTDASLFTVDNITLPASISAGNAVNFSVNFTATGSGLKTAFVHISNNDCDEADYDFSIRGTVANCSVTGTGVAASAACMGNANGSAIITLTGTGSGAPGTYTVDGGTPLNYATNPFTVTNLSAGTHTIVATITESGCISSGIDLQISESVPFSATYTKTNISACGGGSNGSIVVTASGGVLPYTYVWTGGPSGFAPGNVSSVSGLRAGYYNVTVTDAQGCSVMTFTNIHIAFAFSVYITNSGSASGTCGNTGSVILYGNSGILPYTYSLDGINYQQSNTFTNLAAGNYVGYIKDAGGCISSKNITVNLVNSIVLSPYVRPATSCSIDGSIEIYFTGGLSPYSYSLNNVDFQQSNNFLNLAPGNYTAYVKDSKGCIGSKEVTVTRSALLNISVSKKNTSICVNDGSVNISASGGTTPYTYRLNGGAYQVSNTFSALAVGNYSLTVKDFKGCTKTVGVNIGLNEIVVNANTTNASNCTATDGSIQLSAAGGFGPYLYSIDGSVFQTGNIFNNLQAGEYSGYAKDTKGCLGVLAVIPVGPTNCFTKISTVTKNKNGQVGTSPLNNKIVSLNVKAFPNPSEKEFTLFLNGYSNNEKVLITVTDMLGRKIYQTSGTGKQQFKFGSGFMSGMYFVEVAQGAEKKSLKLIKE